MEYQLDKADGEWIIRNAVGVAIFKLREEDENYAREILANLTRLSNANA